MQKIRCLLEVLSPFACRRPNLTSPSNRSGSPRFRDIVITWPWLNLFKIGLYNKHRRGYLFPNWVDFEFRKFTSGSMYHNLRYLQFVSCCNRPSAWQLCTAPWWSFGQTFLYRLLHSGVAQHWLPANLTIVPGAYRVRAQDHVGRFLFH